MNDQEFRDHVVGTLARIETRLKVIGDDQRDGEAAHENLRQKVEAQGRDIARLQVKSGVIGALSGAITAAIGSLIK